MSLIGVASCKIRVHPEPPKPGTTCAVIPNPKQPAGKFSPPRRSGPTALGALESYITYCGGFLGFFIDPGSLVDHI